VSLNIVFDPKLQELYPIITFKNGRAEWDGSADLTGTGQDHGLAPLVHLLVAVRSTVGESTGAYPEAVRAAAGKLIESSCRFLAERYGDGAADEVKIVDWQGHVLIAEGKLV
jgi:hypothetical protein